MAILGRSIRPDDVTKNGGNRCHRIPSTCVRAIEYATRRDVSGFTDSSGVSDLWIDGEPDWAAALAVPDVKLHLYGKGEARVGRKMGHITALGDTVDEAAAKAIAARDVLC